MFAAWSVCAILFASVFGARAAPLETQDPLIEKVREIIADVDGNLAIHHQEKLTLPHYYDIFSPIQLFGGSIGKLSTLELQDGSSVNETKLEDKSSVYVFDLKLGLQEMVVNYYFAAFTEDYKGVGKFSLSVQDNSADMTGFATVQSDNTCKAAMLTLNATRLGNYKVEFETKFVPEAFSEDIIGYLRPNLRDLTNFALEGPLYSARVEQAFSEFVCKRLTSV